MALLAWVKGTRSTAGGRRAGGMLCLLVLLLYIAGMARAGAIPVRPKRAAGRHVLETVPVHSRVAGATARRTAETTEARKGKNAGRTKAGKEKPAGKREKLAAPRGRAAAPREKTARPREKAATRRGQLRKKHKEEEPQDTGMVLQQVRGRATRARRGAAVGAVGLPVQPRWRVHDVPAPVNGNNLVPLATLTAKTGSVPSVSAATGSTLTAAQEADLDQEIREAADGSDDLAGAPALPVVGGPAPATRSDVIAEAELPTVLPGDYRDGRMVVPPLRGSREVLVHQNLMANDAGLERIRNDAQLARLKAGHKLVDFPEGNGLAMNPPLPRNRRCARPWTVRFAQDIARAYSEKFGEPLVVTSAVRTIGYQLRLQRVNGNAAAVDGEGASPHLTGQALDFGKRGMDGQKLSWMRSYLLPLMQAGKIDVEEEFQQACFHISVYRSYAPVKAKVPRTEVAQLHRVER